MNKCYNTKITLKQIEILSFTYTAGNIMCNGKYIQLEKWKTVQPFCPYFMGYLASFANDIWKWNNLHIDWTPDKTSDIWACHTNYI